MAPQHSTKDDNLTTMYNCLLTGAFSDLKITCGDKTWNVHRVVVCPKSSFFRAACVGNFKEAATGVINLDNDNPLAVQLMMDYLYTDDYDIDDQVLPAGSPSKLIIHARMYSLGDKYDMGGLCQVAACQYETVLQDEATIEEYLASIPEVYLPRVSNDLQLAAILHARLELRGYAWSDEARVILKQVMKDVPEFAFELVETFLNAPALGRCRKCKVLHHCTGSR